MPARERPPAGSGALFRSGGLALRQFFLAANANVRNCANFLSRRMLCPARAEERGGIAAGGGGRADTETRRGFCVEYLGGVDYCHDADEAKATLEEGRRQITFAGVAELGRAPEIMQVWQQACSLFTIEFHIRAS